MPLYCRELPPGTTSTTAHIQEVHGISMPEGNANPEWVFQFHEAQHANGYSEREHVHLSYERALEALNGGRT